MIFRYCFRLKLFALETINNVFPSPPWVHVYTDGTAEGSNRNAGAGVYSVQFQLSVPVGKLASNFDAELHAIAIALEEVAKRDFCKTALLVDFQAAISAVTGYDDKDDIIIGYFRKGNESWK
uniref:RNase H domain-containing protein n=1 Tax=Rhodnius prolixus TaxID=13249 RepID=T1HJR6_RHOPR